MKLCWDKKPPLFPGFARPEKRIKPGNDNCHPKTDRAAKSLGAMFCASIKRLLTANGKLRLFSLLSLAACLVLPRSAGAQEMRELSRTGTVIDSLRAPVEGATVRIFPGGHASTDEQGRFPLRAHPRIDSISVSAIGYESRTVSEIEFENAGNTVWLRRSVVELGAITLALNSGNPHRVISKLDIKLRAVTNSQELLRLVPGLFIGQHAGGGKAEQLFLRGFDIDHGTDVNIAVRQYRRRRNAGEHGLARARPGLRGSAFPDSGTDRQYFI
jgi:hypothetical protein